MEEIYKDIPGYEGKYQVSNIGNVKSLISNKILKPGKNAYGYLIVNLVKDKKSKCIQIHQLVAMAFLGHVRNGHTITVDHINHVRDDNRVENLQLLTMRENATKGKSRNPDKSSQFTGVCYYEKRKTKPYMSYIQHNKKVKNLGYYETELEAANAYINALNQIKKSDGC